MAANTDTTRAELPLGLRSTSGRNRRLREALAAPGIVVAPGVYDCITARLVERAGFDACYITGSGVSMSCTGAPDVGFISFAEVLDRAGRIADSTSIPVIADADTGFGGPLNIMRTVHCFERAGISAVQIEDQVLPKRCGHEPGRQVVEAGVMCDRIAAAVDARVDPDLVIIARTDARTMHGLDAALERALLYQQAGADVIFVESPESREELARIPPALPVPALANMVEGGRTPILAAHELADLGFALAIFPNSLTRLFACAGAQLLASLREDGTTAAHARQMLTHTELWDLFDNESWIAAERRVTGSLEP